MLISDYVRMIMVEAATLLGRSLDVYWPVNIGGLNDLPERNLSMHFAHAAIKRDFHVFAEAKNFTKTREERLDILCISPDKKYYIPCEFKTYVHNSMEKSYHTDDNKCDISRVATFPLNLSLPEEVFGTNFMNTLKNCQRRLGVVAGILWRYEGDPVGLVGVGQNRFQGNVEKLGGSVDSNPILIKAYDPPVKSKVTSYWRGAYYLYYALIGDSTFEVDETGHLSSTLIGIHPESSHTSNISISSHLPPQTTTPKHDQQISQPISPASQSTTTAKAILRSYKDACYGTGINGTTSKCNTSKSDKSRIWLATYDMNDNPIWLCSHCGCEWIRKEKAKVSLA